MKSFVTLLSPQEAQQRLAREFDLLNAMNDANKKEISMRQSEITEFPPEKKKREKEPPKKNVFKV